MPATVDRPPRPAPTRWNVARLVASSVLLAAWILVLVYLACTR